jgi:triacylglycerol esterase/lipase EstA (alpha/beta hydrolase family)
MQEKIKSIKIDFDDGLGYRKVFLNAKQQVNYNSVGEKTVKIKIKYSDNSVYKTQFIQNVIVLSTPSPSAVWQLRADISYKNKYALGEAYVWQSGSLDKPVVVIEGFDAKEQTGQDELYAILNQRNLLETLRSIGYDFIVLNFDYSKDYIQRNAFLVAKLLHRVNYEKRSNEPLVLIGASMGGLVSRYALTYMERYHMSHDVRTFISFDSPQKGATNIG